MNRLICLVAMLGLLTLGLTSCFSRSDSLAPVINITSPKNGTTKSASNLTIIGYALDDKGIQALRVQGNDLLATPELASEHNKKLIQFAFRPAQIREGKFGALIEAEDTNGRVTKLRYNLEIDATVPEIKLTTPKRLGNGRVSVTGAARDNNLIERIIINGADVPLGAVREKFFTTEIASADVVEAVVIDQAGNRNTWTVNVP